MKHIDKEDNVLHQMASPLELRLLEEALAIGEEDAKKAGAISYMARVLAQVTMPHSNPKTNEFIRKNGNLTISIVGPEKPGLPYGPIPRLVLSWLTTEAVRTKERRIILGTTLSEFMRDIGLGNPTGGRWGSITRLRDQLKRLFSSTIHCIYDGPLEDKNYFRNKKIDIAEDSHLWWDPKTPEQAGLWQSEVLLTKTFFDQIIERPVPIDKRALKALKRSPMALDLYIWLTHRMSYLPEPRTIPWDALRMQFGAEYANTAQGKYEFKRKLLQQLKKVKVIYPDVNVRDEDSGLFLAPSRPHIPMKPR